MIDNYSVTLLFVGYLCFFNSTSECFIYAVKNVKVQRSQRNSHLNIVRKLLSLRKNPKMKYGSLDMEVLNNGTVLAYKREIKRSSRRTQVFVILLNLGKSDQSVLCKKNLPSKLKVVVISTQAENYRVG